MQLSKEPPTASLPTLSPNIGKRVRPDKKAFLWTCPSVLRIACNSRLTD
jgi:hypothetical protein